LTPAETPIPYAPIERHAVIGDRATAALVSADGTIDWLCLPLYGSEPVLASLIDAASGGYFRFGPAEHAWGTQAYVDATAVLETTFQSADGGELVATDAMILPSARAHEAGSSQAIVRHLACRGGAARCVFAFRPRRGDGLHVWCSAGRAESGVLDFTLRAGEEAWAVLSFGDASSWSEARARASSDETIAHWRRFAAGIERRDGRGGRVLRSLLTIHLLGSARNGSVVAAATTSLPERIGGDLNYDYRLSWIRDSSLAVEALALHGDLDSAQRYLDWLVGLEASGDPPLRVVYKAEGDGDPVERVRGDFAGYRGSGPVRTGNRACKQSQLGAFGFVADCLATYFECGGSWNDRYFQLLARIADHGARHWREPDNGIWEIPTMRRHVSSLVMCWVALDRAVTVAEKWGRPERARGWRRERDALRADVLEHGYHAGLGAFRHAYDVDGLDASSLLVPITGFLAPDDPRVASTVDRIARELTIDGHVHRYDPKVVLGSEALPFGEHEPSFLLCTCWLATAYALAGKTALAEAALARVERCGGSLGVFPEGVDARSGALRGNYPLLFTHAEYLRAVRAIERAPASRRVR
jgi:GH15 family glucan-1,4-alpha-glucosidase